MQTYKVYLPIVFLFTFSITSPVILTLIINFLSVEQKPIYTAILMYIPITISIFCVYFSSNGSKYNRNIIENYILLLCLTIPWLIVFLKDFGFTLNYLSLSTFDNKRIWFFIHGVVLSSIFAIGISRRPIVFIECFLLSFILFSLLISILYILSYDKSLSFYRLLGDKALVVGIFASFGISCCFGLLILLENKHVANGFSFLTAASIILIILFVVSILFSGTRAALLGAILSFVAYVTLSNKRKNIILILIFLTVVGYFTGSIVFKIIPSATLERLTMLNEQGIDIRISLLKNMIQLIYENPYGKIFGYQFTKLDMDYSHNTLLQYIAEASIFSLFPLSILFFIATVKLIASLYQSHYKALLIFLLNVFFHSFSHGNAYNPFVWMSLFFLSSIQVKKYQVKNTFKLS